MWPEVARRGRRAAHSAPGRPVLQHCRGGGVGGFPLSFANMNDQALTIVFADVSGSTRLFEQRGDTVARETILGLLNLCAEVVTSHGGEVIKTMGDEIMATFSSVEHGIEAAAEMQRRVSDEASCRRERLALRIGLHHGDVLHEGDDVFGAAVNTAARMVSLAKRDQIVTTADSVRNLAASSGVCTRSLGKTHVPGKRGLLDIVDIIWQENTTNITSFREADVLAEVHHDTRLALEFQGVTVTMTETSQPLVLGRDPSADVVVEAEWVSRYHAAIEYRRGFFVLSDASTNGSFVSLGGDIPVFLHRDELLLRGSGTICLGQSCDKDPSLALGFRCS